MVVLVAGSLRVGSESELRDCAGHLGGPVQVNACFE